MKNPGHKIAFVRLRSKPNGEWLVHPDLRQRLVDDAIAQESNLTDVALQILAERFKFTLEPSGRKTDPSADQDLINLRLPWKLYAAIDRAKTQHRRKGYIDEIRHVLCDHYGLDVPDPPKHSRNRRAAAV